MCIDLFGDPACWSFADVLSIDGCSAKCGVKVHQLLELDVLSYHHYFTQLNKSAKRQWMLDYFRTHSSMNETTYMIGGKTVCQKIWIAALGVPTSVFFIDFDNCTIMEQSKSIVYQNSHFSAPLRLWNGFANTLI